MDNNTKRNIPARFLPLLYAFQSATRSPQHDIHALFQHEAAVLKQQQQQREQEEEQQQLRNRGGENEDDSDEDVAGHPSNTFVNGEEAYAKNKGAALAQAEKAKRKNDKKERDEAKEKNDPAGKEVTTANTSYNRNHAQLLQEIEAAEAMAQRWTAATRRIAHAVQCAPFLHPFLPHTSHAAAHQSSPLGPTTPAPSSFPLPQFNTTIQSIVDEILLLSPHSTHSKPQVAAKGAVAATSDADDLPGGHCGVGGGVAVSSASSAHRVLQHLARCVAPRSSNTRSSPATRGETQQHGEEDEVVTIPRAMVVVGKAEPPTASGVQAPPPAGKVMQSTPLNNDGESKNRIIDEKRKKKSGKNTAHNDTLSHIPPAADAIAVVDDAVLLATEAEALAADASRLARLEHLLEPILSDPTSHRPSSSSSHRRSPPTGAVCGQVADCLLALATFTIDAFGGGGASQVSSTATFHANASGTSASYLSTVDVAAPRAIATAMVYLLQHVDVEAEGEGQPSSCVFALRILEALCGGDGGGPTSSTTNNNKSSAATAPVSLGRAWNKAVMATLSLQPSQQQHINTAAGNDEDSREEEEVIEEDHKDASSSYYGGGTLLDSTATSSIHSSGTSHHHRPRSSGSNRSRPTSAAGNVGRGEGDCSITDEEQQQEAAEAVERFLPRLVQALNATTSYTSVAAAAVTVSLNEKGDYDYDDEHHRPNACARVVGALFLGALALRTLAEAEEAEARDNSSSDDGLCKEASELLETVQACHQLKPSTPTSNATPRATKENTAPSGEKNDDQLVKSRQHAVQQRALAAAERKNKKDHSIQSNKNKNKNKNGLVDTDSDDDDEDDQLSASKSTGARAVEAVAPSALLAAVCGLRARMAAAEDRLLGMCSNYRYKISYACGEDAFAAEYRSHSQQHQSPSSTPPPPMFLSLLQCVANALVVLPAAAVALVDGRALAQAFLLDRIALKRSLQTSSSTATTAIGEEEEEEDDERGAEDAGAVNRSANRGPPLPHSRTLLDTCTASLGKYVRRIQAWQMAAPNTVTTVPTTAAAAAAVASSTSPSTTQSATNLAVVAQLVLRSKQQLAVEAALMRYRQHNSALLAAIAGSASAIQTQKTTTTTKKKRNSDKRPTPGPNEAVADVEDHHRGEDLLLLCLRRGLQDLFVGAVQSTLGQDHRAVLRTVLVHNASVTTSSSSHGNGNAFGAATMPITSIRVATASSSSAASAMWARKGTTVVGGLGLISSSSSSSFNTTSSLQQQQLQLLQQQQQQQQEQQLLREVMQRLLLSDKMYTRFLTANTLQSPASSSSAPRSNSSSGGAGGGENKNNKKKTNNTDSTSPPSGGRQSFQPAWSSAHNNNNSTSPPTAAIAATSANSPSSASFVRIVDDDDDEDYEDEVDSAEGDTTTITTTAGIDDISVIRGVGAIGGVDDQDEGEVDAPPLDVDAVFAAFGRTRSMTNASTSSSSGTTTTATGTGTTTGGGASKSAGKKNQRSLSNSSSGGRSGGVHNKNHRSIGSGGSGSVSSTATAAARPTMAASNAAVGVSGGGASPSAYSQSYASSLSSSSSSSSPLFSTCALQDVDGLLLTPLLLPDAHRRFLAALAAALQRQVTQQSKSNNFNNNHHKKALLLRALQGLLERERLDAKNNNSNTNNTSSSSATASPSLDLSVAASAPAALATTAASPLPLRRSFDYFQLIFAVMATATGGSSSVTPLHVLYASYASPNTTGSAGGETAAATAAGITATASTTTPLVTTTAYPGVGGSRPPSSSGLRPQSSSSSLHQQQSQPRWQTNPNIDQNTENSNNNTSNNQNNASDDFHTQQQQHLQLQLLEEQQRHSDEYLFRLLWKVHLSAPDAPRKLLDKLHKRTTTDSRAQLLARLARPTSAASGKAKNNSSNSGGNNSTSTSPKSSAGKKNEKESGKSSSRPTSATAATNTNKAALLKLQHQQQQQQQKQQEGQGGPRRIPHNTNQKNTTPVSSSSPSSSSVSVLDLLLDLVTAVNLLQLPTTTEKTTTNNGTDINADTTVVDDDDDVLTASGDDRSESSCNGNGGGDDPDDEEEECGSSSSSGTKNPRARVPAVRDASSNPLSAGTTTISRSRHHSRRHPSKQSIAPTTISTNKSIYALVGVQAASLDPPLTAVPLAQRYVRYYHHHTLHEDTTTSAAAPPHNTAAQKKTTTTTTTTTSGASAGVSSVGANSSSNGIVPAVVSSANAAAGGAAGVQAAAHNVAVLPLLTPRALRRNRRKMRMKQQQLQQHSLAPSSPPSSLSPLASQQQQRKDEDDEDDKAVVAIAAAAGKGSDASPNNNRSGNGNKKGRPNSGGRREGRGYAVTAALEAAQQQQQQDQQSAGVVRGGGNGNNKKGTAHASSSSGSSNPNRLLLLPTSSTTGTKPQQQSAVAGKKCSDDNDDNHHPLPHHENGTTTTSTSATTSLSGATNTSTATVGRTLLAPIVVPPPTTTTTTTPNVPTITTTSSVTPATRTRTMDAMDLQTLSTVGSRNKQQQQQTLASTTTTTSATLGVADGPDGANATAALRRRSSAPVLLPKITSSSSSSSSAAATNTKASSTTTKTNTADTSTAEYQKKLAAIPPPPQLQPPRTQPIHQGSAPSANFDVPTTTTLTDTTTITTTPPRRVESDDEYDPSVVHRDERDALAPYAYPDLRQHHTATTATTATVDSAEPTDAAVVANSTSTSTYKAAKRRHDYSRYVQEAAAIVIQKAARTHIGASYALAATTTTSATVNGNRAGIAGTDAGGVEGTSSSLSVFSPSSSTAGRVRLLAAVGHRTARALMALDLVQIPRSSTREEKREGVVTVVGTASNGDAPSSSHFYSPSRTLFLSMYDDIETARHFLLQNYRHQISELHDYGSSTTASKTTGASKTPAAAEGGSSAVYLSVRYARALRSVLRDFRRYASACRTIGRFYYRYRRYNKQNRGTNNSQSARLRTVPTSDASPKMITASPSSSWWAVLVLASTLLQRCGRGYLLRAGKASVAVDSSTNLSTTTVPTTTTTTTTNVTLQSLWRLWRVDYARNCTWRAAVVWQARVDVAARRRYRDMTTSTYDEGEKKKHAAATALTVPVQQADAFPSFSSSLGTPPPPPRAVMVHAWAARDRAALAAVKLQRTVRGFLARRRCRRRFHLRDELLLQGMRDYLRQQQQQKQQQDSTISPVTAVSGTLPPFLEVPLRFARAARRIVAWLRTRIAVRAVNEKRAARRNLLVSGSGVLLTSTRTSSPSIATVRFTAAEHDRRVLAAVRLQRGVVRGILAAKREAQRRRDDRQAAIAAAAEAERRRVATTEFASVGQQFRWLKKELLQQQQSQQVPTTASTKITNNSEADGGCAALVVGVVDDAARLDDLAALKLAMHHSLLLHQQEEQQSGNKNGGKASLMGLDKKKASLYASSSTPALVAAAADATTAAAAPATHSFKKDDADNKNNTDIVGLEDQEKDHYSSQQQEGKISCHTEDAVAGGDACPLAALAETEMMRRHLKRIGRVAVAAAVPALPLAAFGISNLPPPPPPPLSSLKIAAEACEQKNSDDGGNDSDDNSGDDSTPFLLRLTSHLAHNVPPALLYVLRVALCSEGDRWSHYQQQQQQLEQQHQQQQGQQGSAHGDGAKHSQNNGDGYFGKHYSEVAYEAAVDIAARRREVERALLWNAHFGDGDGEEDNEDEGLDKEKAYGQQQEEEEEDYDCGEEEEGEDASPSPIAPPTRRQQGDNEKEDYADIDEATEEAAVNEQQPHQGEQRCLSYGSPSTAPAGAPTVAIITTINNNKQVSSLGVCSRFEPATKQRLLYAGPSEPAAAAGVLLDCTPTEMVMLRHHHKQHNCPPRQQKSIRSSDAATKNKKENNNNEVTSSTTSIAVPPLWHSAFDAALPSIDTPWSNASRLAKAVSESAASLAWRSVFSHTRYDAYKQEALIPADRRQERAERLARVEQRNQCILACYRTAAVSFATTTTTTNTTTIIGENGNAKAVMTTTMKPKPLRDVLAADLGIASIEDVFLGGGAATSATAASTTTGEGRWFADVLDDIRKVTEIYKPARDSDYEQAAERLEQLQDHLRLLTDAMEEEGEEEHEENEQKKGKEEVGLTSTPPSQPQSLSSQIAKMREAVAVAAAEVDRLEERRLESFYFTYDFVSQCFPDTLRVEALAALMASNLATITARKAMPTGEGEESATEEASPATAELLLLAATVRPPMWATAMAPYLDTLPLVHRRLNGSGNGGGEEQLVAMMDDDPNNSINDSNTNQEPDQAQAAAAPPSGSGDLQHLPAMLLSHGLQQLLIGLFYRYAPSTPADTAPAAEMKMKASSPLIATSSVADNEPLLLYLSRYLQSHLQHLLVVTTSIAQQQRSLLVQKNSGGENNIKHSSQYLRSESRTSSATTTDTATTTAADLPPARTRMIDDDDDALYGGQREEHQEEDGDEDYYTRKEEYNYDDFGEEEEDDSDENAAEENYRRRRPPPPPRPANGMVKSLFAKDDDDDDEEYDEEDDRHYRIIEEEEDDEDEDYGEQGGTDHDALNAMLRREIAAMKKNMKNEKADEDEEGEVEGINGNDNDTQHSPSRHNPPSRKKAGTSSSLHPDLLLHLMQVQRLRSLQQTLRDAHAAYVTSSTTTTMTTEEEEQFLQAEEEQCPPAANLFWSDRQRRRYALVLAVASSLAQVVFVHATSTSTSATTSSASRTPAATLTTTAAANAGMSHPKPFQLFRTIAQQAASAIPYIPENKYF